MRFTFDRKRQLTDFAHLLRDHREGPAVSRQEHYAEWAELVEQCQPEHVTDRVRQLTEEHRRIHFHVWTPTEFIAFLTACRSLTPGFDLLHLEVSEKDCIVLMQKRPLVPDTAS